MSSLAFFLALGGGAAWAANEFTGANIKDETLTGADVKGRAGVNGTLTGLDLRDGTVQRRDLGASARDSCPAGTVRRGALCARSPNSPRDWGEAGHYCAGLRLRLPTASEAMAMAMHYSIPGVTTDEAFWTNDVWTDGGPWKAFYVVGGYDNVSESGVQSYGAANEVVCVTPPSN